MCKNVKTFTSYRILLNTCNFEVVWLHILFVKHIFRTLNTTSVKLWFLVYILKYNPLVWLSQVFSVWNHYRCVWQLHKEFASRCKSYTLSLLLVCAWSVGKCLGKSSLSHQHWKVLPCFKHIRMLKWICHIKHPQGRYSLNSFVSFLRFITKLSSVSACVKAGLSFILSLAQTATQHWTIKISTVSLRTTSDTRKPFGAKCATTTDQQRLINLQEYYKDHLKSSMLPNDRSRSWYRVLHLLIYRSPMSTNKADPQPVFYMMMICVLHFEALNLHLKPAHKHASKLSISCVLSQRWGIFVHTWSHNNSHDSKEGVKLKDRV